MLGTLSGVEKWSGKVERKSGVEKWSGEVEWKNGVEKGKGKRGVKVEWRRESVEKGSVKKGMWRRGSGERRVECEKEDCGKS